MAIVLKLFQKKDQSRSTKRLSTTSSRARQPILRSIVQLSLIRSEDTQSHVAFIVHDEIVLDIHEDDKYLIPELKEVFQNNKLGSFRANVKAGKNYGKLKELKL